MTRLSASAPARLCGFAAAVTMFLASCGGAQMPSGPSDTPLGSVPTTSVVPPGANFDVTFMADQSCANLPEDARARAYTATLHQGSSLARLGGAMFPDGGPYGLWNTVSVSMGNDSVNIWFQDPPIWESLADGAYLVIYGDAHGRLAAEGTTIPFWGRFEYCRQGEPDAYPECVVPVTTCESSAHRLILNPR